MTDGLKRRAGLSPQPGPSAPDCEQYKGERRSRFFRRHGDAGVWHAVLSLAFSLLIQDCAPAASFSLAGDFSYTENSSNSLWSYRLDDFAHQPPDFPLLSSTNRNANTVWGSDFPTPPTMWSDDSGYWGIGENLTGRELFSSKNGTRWASGEVLFHPKGGASPAGLVVGWTAPSNMVIEVKYALGHATGDGNGIGYRIGKRSAGADSEIVALDGIGSGLTNELTGLVVAKDDQLFFRFNTRGDPSGDISRAAITIQGLPWAAAQAMASHPSGGTITAGSDFGFNVRRAGARSFQWFKDGQPIPGANHSSYELRNLKLTDAGAYSVAIDSVPGREALLSVTAKAPMWERFRSPTPRQVFSQLLVKQEEELKTNVLMLRFAQSRKKLTADPYRPTYHFVSPESMMNDPNGPCFWQGHWHLFYQVFPPDAFPDPKDRQNRLLQAHWGHAITDDWVHWRDLPYAIYPGVERVSASGGTVVEEKRVVAFYPGFEAGQMVAIASDPLLLNWKKLGESPVNSPVGDSCIWKEGDTYFGLASATVLVSSKSLADWTVHGGFLEGNPFPMGDAIACPSFLPIGDKHILLSFSHTRGGQYLLGDYDKQRHQFRPYEHGLFNHGTVAPGGVHAPTGVVDGKRGVIAIHNINDGRHTEDWDQLLSLPQHLTLGPDKRLRIEPVETISSLRGSHRRFGETVMPANREIVFEAAKGNAMELEVEIDPKDSRWVQLNVLRSPQGEEQTSITFYNYDRRLAFWYPTRGVVCLDGSRSSNLPDAWPRTPEKADLERAGEPLKLRVFVDHSVVEVFANERLYLAMRVYPGRSDSVGVSVRAQGQDAVLKRLEAWSMNSIWD